ncbi:helix-turn-helix domain-containing protein [Providencia stuartii]|uniref:Helix-turn-helix domain-containing protein n=1 Tax=Providencia huashanensis TaxID=3037798 RepID=A0ABT9ALV6_9GAMM|nr:MULTISPECIES: helix-turn-helix domain-containing protein [unclassified Providencia]MDN0007455.1 helix-turn-helix domain-containing protein [Providencia stuartii]MDO7829489.1 helix-turn-helix domain-containing protein [Providencia sp. CRE-138-0026]MDO7855566.1 helix-turn-helix domain-containing protein [Providencia sp. CRE-138-0111]
MNTQDWHRADIRAALEKRGTNLRTLSTAAGLAADTLRNALVRPWPKGEKIIASAIGVEPSVIWPSRYTEQ